MKQPWTRLEEVEACTLRWLHFTIEEIARRLGRSPSSVHARLRNLLPSYERMHKPGQLARKVRRLHGRGLDDGEIAIRTNTDRRTIGHTRRRLGLPAIRNSVEVARLGGLARAGKLNRDDDDSLVRCLACDKVCPSYNQLHVHGWVSRPLAGHPSCREVYCRACFRRWGWPSLPSREVPA